ncbi:VOC family protein [Candidatus Aminicenantes bacterium AH-873-B07]|jgi:catechol 2,3-dioxygenase-like lactoylglutathione lyase family enzyme|nr:VOC family protein [Candidatus Aminicenantes bacterium AH-873-B07]
MEINHIALICSSEEVADKFYKNFLGLNKIRTFIVSSNMAYKIFNFIREYKVILYSNNQIKIEVFIDEEYKGNKNSISHICIEVKSREELISKAKKFGIHYLKIPKQDSFYLFIRDHDGNLFEVKEMN